MGLLGIIDRLLILPLSCFCGSPFAVADSIVHIGDKVGGGAVKGGIKFRTAVCPDGILVDCLPDHAVLGQRLLGILMEAVQNVVQIALGSVTGHPAAALIKGDRNAHRDLQVGFEHIGHPGQRGIPFKFRLHLEVHGEIEHRTLGFCRGGNVVDLQAAGGEDDVLGRALLLDAAALPLQTGELHIHLGDRACRLLILHLVGGILRPLVGSVHHAAYPERKHYQGNHQRNNRYDQ